MKPRTKSSAPLARTQLRIIGGQWRGRKLSFPELDGLRPTGDRIRETLFNWLAPRLPGAHCLDLFAGSGALGLEALSRGAGATVLLEKDRHAAQQLRDNLHLLGSERAKIVAEDSLQWLRQGPTEQAFDVVFIDPPFQHNLWQAAIDTLEQNAWLAPEAVIYVESGRDVPYQTPLHWRLHRDKNAGQVTYRLYVLEPSPCTETSD